MKENVYCVYDIMYNRLGNVRLHIYSEGDGVIYSNIFSGIAKFKGKNYYFEQSYDPICYSLSSKEERIESKKYYLTLLDKNIFKLSMENWEYVKEWFIHKNIPDPYEYIEKRKTMTFSQIFSDVNIEKNIMELTEKYFQNDIIIKKYLENTKPINKADGKFYIAKGILYDVVKMINSGIKVEWKNRQKIKY